MKVLYIIRHAKSSWKNLSLDDFDRPLNKRGEANAPMMGKRLNAKNIVPDLIISSPAKRAKSTSEIIAKEVKYKKNIIFNDSLYDSTTKIMQNILEKTDNENDVVFLVGHNPDLNILADIYLKFDENIPTCGIVEVAFNCDRWEDISKNSAKLVSFDYPKNINFT